MKTFAVINKSCKTIEDKTYRTRKAAENRAAGMRRDWPEFEWGVAEMDLSDEDQRGDSEQTAASEVLAIAERLAGLASGKPLGEFPMDADGQMAWRTKSRRIDRIREAASRLAAVLEEIDGE